MPGRLLLYARTIRHLRPVQVTNRIWRRLYRPAIPGRTEPALRPVVSAFIPGIGRPATVLGPNRVRFLSEEGSIESSAAWNDPSRAKLWLYQLHYFDDLCAADAPLRRELHRELIERWIRENPPGCGVGWDPYPLSLRIVNWIKWHLSGNALDDAALASLAQQVRYLRPRLEYHLLGNHLLENLKTLVVAGCFFAGAEADSWRVDGLRMLQKQVSEQVLPDGGHFELAPMYHGIVLEGLLDVVNVLRTYGFAVPEWLSAACRRMVRWSAAMVHPDGEWAQFNDTALGFAARPDALQAYAERLGIEVPLQCETLTVLRDSGFVRAARGPWVLFADVGDLGPDYNPAHGHADTLSFELSCRQERLIVDTGVSTYETGPLRSFQRSTRAHNTVEVDSEDSSEVWASFRVARRARAHDLQAVESPEATVIVGEHDGYRRLRGNPIHRREWRLTDDTLIVTDTVLSRGKHRLTARIHLHPRYRVRQSSPELMEIVDGSGACVATLSRGSWPTAQIESYHYSPTFGQTVPGAVVALSATCDTAATLHFMLAAV